MRHLLWIPMGLVGLLLMSSLAGMVSSAAAGGLSVLGSIEFILLVLAECVLFSAWVVGCEVAANRQDNEAEQIRTRNLLRELHGEEGAEDENQGGYGTDRGESGLTPEQIAEYQAERAEREEKLARKLGK